VKVALIVGVILSSPCIRGPEGIIVSLAERAG
jgi:hypothetical protein